jgi:hypothetical protein
VERNLERKCRFSDSRFSSDEDKGTFNEAAAKNTVDLAIVQRYTALD